MVKQVGYPNAKFELSGKEIWNYGYSVISALPGAANNNESTVFECNKAGRLLDAYKTNGGADSNGNPLLKAAGM